MSEVPAPARQRRGTCPVCRREDIPIVNYAVERGGEVGYLGRHWRPGTRRDANCRGSFGGWVERKKRPAR